MIGCLVCKVTISTDIGHPSALLMNSLLAIFFNKNLEIQIFGHTFAVYYHTNTP